VSNSECAASDAANAHSSVVDVAPRSAAYTVRRPTSSPPGAGSLVAVAAVAIAVLSADATTVGFPDP
jgi:hypothetical protein